MFTKPFHYGGFINHSVRSLQIKGFGRAVGLIIEQFQQVRHITDSRGSVNVRNKLVSDLKVIHELKD